MAVTIKLKNASGSDPSASDLVVGEVALRTDNGKLFTKKDNGSVAEISGAGVQSGAIVDADINASANISKSKLAIADATSSTSGYESAADKAKLDGIESGATADQSASEILTLIKTVDGAGSGLDADTLDGVSSASFLRSDAADTASGDITFSGGAGAATIAANSDISFTNGTFL